jgi:hypothetical protein
MTMTNDLALNVLAEGQSPEVGSGPETSGQPV